jgi:hypothetical protein
MDAMSARKILVIKNSDEIHYRHEKNHHNYASEPVYDNFIKFLMTFSCLKLRMLSQSSLNGASSPLTRSGPRARVSYCAEVS